MWKVFITQCAMLLLASGCAVATGGPSQRAGEPIRAVIKLTRNDRPCLGKPIELTMGLVNEGFVPGASISRTRTTMIH
jgi:hypothetical protein